MSITFVPHPGEVLMCDFSTGFKPPEMVKVRRVVVLSPRNRVRFPGTYIVVPVSKTTPSPPQGCHCEFKPRAYGFFDPVESVWAKADMIVSVAAHRLERLRINGRFTSVRIREGDLMRVRNAVLHALGMEKWREVEESVAPSLSAKTVKIAEIKIGP
jgi:uncharacterized protein YifN (PemK superfamily)